MRACCFIIRTDKFINRYMAEGILCNCLEANSTLQLIPTIILKYILHVVVMPLHKTCTSTYATSIVALLDNYTY